MYILYIVFLTIMSIAFGIVRMYRNLGICGGVSPISPIPLK